jgi:hypothetical protein
VPRSPGHHEDRSGTPRYRSGSPDIIDIDLEEMEPLGEAEEPQELGIAENVEMDELQLDRPEDGEGPDGGDEAQPDES